jgi:protein TonB
MNILQSGGALDSEVLRVVAKMPKWKPGIQNGRFVPVYFTLPVTFMGPEL